jgi:hypothetical protein
MAAAQNGGAAAQNGGAAANGGDRAPSSKARSDPHHQWRDSGAGLSWATNGGRAAPCSDLRRPTADSCAAPDGNAHRDKVAR